MKQFTVNKTIKLTEIQNKTLNKLKIVYKINTQDFIRQAIAEKIKRDFKNIKVPDNNKVKCPF
jgi:hypothetical protein